MTVKIRAKPSGVHTATIITNTIHTAILQPLCSYVKKSVMTPITTDKSYIPISDINQINLVIPNHNICHTLRIAKFA